jgi:hypothetical protein
MLRQCQKQTPIILIIMSNINIIGRFFFKLTDNKNLIGEFSNNLSKRNCTESADRILEKGNDGTFVGEYFTTWHDQNENGQNHSCFLTKLEIKRKHENIFSLIFSLKWWRVQKNGQPEANPFFWGEGILCDGILIGDYRNFDPIK